MSSEIMQETTPLVECCAFHLGYTGISVTSSTSKESAETRSGTRAIAEAIFTIGLSNI